AYDTSKYKAPENPELPEFGGVKLAQNKEEELLLELLPAVAGGFLRKRRAEEYAAIQQAAAEAEAAVKAAAEPEIEEDPITGEVLQAPMGGTIISINVKPGDKVKTGDILLVYEAMKMENEVEAEHDAVIKRVFVEPGQVVGLEANLIEFED
ncbi:MAG: acetyl-CoA carboxylase biotin carboxyl carrier protein subunit, partial [Muribaculaceae bacterium]|nr:acetyl-CoA carboxylase biotin carboxyl carrier protein subunit [Muribaculaceae bacterium]